MKPTNYDDHMKELESTQANVEKEMDYKFAVVKIRDIDNLLGREDQQTMYRLLNKIYDERQSLGKKNHNYVVVNTDETYIGQVVDILKQNGHWGRKGVQNAYAPLPEDLK